HSSRGRSDCVDHALSPLARRGRTSPRQLALRSTAVVALSFFYDVQPVSISQLQGSELEDEEIDSAFSYHYPCSHFYRAELRMDASRSVPVVLALWSTEAMALARMAARNRRGNRRRIPGRCGRANTTRSGVV